MKASAMVTVFLQSETVTISKAIGLTTSVKAKAVTFIMIRINSSSVSG